MEPGIYIDNDGIMCMSYKGDQTAETIQETVGRAKLLIEKIKQKNKLALILVDLHKLGSINAEARRVGSEALTQIPYDRIAIFGASRFLRYMVTLIIKGSGKSDVVRYFAAEPEARKWLLGQYS